MVFIQRCIYILPCVYDYFVYSLVSINMIELSPMLIVLISFHNEKLWC